MNEVDVGHLLLLLQELDGRHSANEAKVRAWHEMFREQASGMSLEFARETVKSHYAILDEMFTPAMLVRAFRKRSQAHSGIESNDAHCRKSGCACTHSVCFRGWIDYENLTSPCGVCRAELSEVLALIPPPGRRSEQDFARIRFRGE